MKSVFAAFVAGALAGFLAATGNAAEPDAQTSRDTAPISASAWAQR